MGRIAALTRNPAIVALVMGLAIAGCASKKNLNSAADLGLGAGGAGTPGSSQDFTVNIGDRIFFDTDSSVDPRRRAGDAVQAGAVAEQIRQLRHHRRRPCRRARHPRVQSGARRAPRRRYPRLPGRPRRSAQPHEDNLLRQGTSGRGLRRHFLLVAESPRGHRAQRRRQLSLYDLRQHGRVGRKSGALFHTGRLLLPAQTKFGRDHSAW